MTEPTAEPTPTSHDKLFKQLLRWFLPDFLRLFFPDKAAHLNFDTLSFVDKELILPMLSQERRISDVVAEVETVDGEPELLLVHVEVEAGDKASLPARMFEYYALLRLLRQLPVLPFTLLLLPNAGGLGSVTYREQLFGEDVLTLTYGQVGLRDLDGEAYFDPDNPLAATLAVLMQVDEKRQAALKLASLQSLLGSPLTEERKLFLMKMVDTYLPTEELVEVGAETMEALQELGTHWTDKVFEEGREEGRRELLLHQLRVKFGSLPADFEAQLKAIDDIEALDRLSEKVLTANSLDEIALPGRGVEPTEDDA